MGDPRVAQGRRWRVLWVHHEAEELRVHYRATIPEMTARHVIVDLLASGQAAQMNAGWLVTRPPGSRPTLQRLWGTVWQDDEAAYLVLFLNDRCLLLPLSPPHVHLTNDSRAIAQWPPPSWISTVLEARRQRGEGGQTGPKPGLPGRLALQKLGPGLSSSYRDG